MDPVIIGIGGPVGAGKTQLVERITRHLADGGMGSVFVATDLRLERDIALKVMRSDLARDDAFVARFRREAHSAARLTHPNVVAVTDQGSDGHYAFLAMELVLGETLSPKQILGGALILVGVLSVSIAGGKARRHFRWKLAALMLTCGFIMSLSTLIFKAFAVKDEFWATTFWMFAGEAVYGVLFLCIPFYRRQFAGLLRSNGGALLAINASNELINLGGGLANRYALIFAPLSIVQAIGSTTTLFVFLIGVLLTVLFPSVSREDLSKRECVSKGLAALLVAAGITLVSR